MIQAKQTEPPSWNRPPLFMIGQDAEGHWVAQDLYGTCGGLFVNRAAALRFVRFENAGRPQTVVMVSGVLELDAAGKADSAPRRQSGGDVREQRRVA